jgi:hypothetical protein
MYEQHFSFIETSKGYINLSLVKTIKVQRDIVWFRLSRNVLGITVIGAHWR